MMTEEFNESMINDIKEGDKITGEVQQLKISTLLFTSMAVNTTVLFN